MSRIYLYGFVPPDARLPENGLLGIADGVVELVEGDGMAAAVSPVPDGTLDDRQIEARSADLEWMAEQGLQHEQVVAWFVDHASILPSGLLTLFSSRQAVLDVMERDATRLRHALERLVGVREWDLKVSYDADTLAGHLAEVSEPIAALDREIAAATPGKQFLLRKKRADLTRTEGRAAARRLGGELLEDVAASARQTRRMPPPADNAPVVTNAALLVEREREPDLLEQARQARKRLERVGVHVQLSGPWAPYRFVEAEGE